MKQQNKRTVGIYIVIIILVVVAAIVIFRWRVPHATQAPSNAQTESLADKAKKYEVIKEWNIRFQPTQGLGEVVYSTGEQPGTEGVAFFSTSALEGYGTACGATQQGSAPLGRLLRVRTDNQDMPTAGVAHTVQIGPYTYMYVTPQTICSDDKKALETQTNLLKLFKESITSLEAVGE